MDQYVRLSLGRNFEDLEGVLDRIDVWTAKKMQEKREAEHIRAVNPASGEGRKKYENGKENRSLSISAFYI
ncbi:hypothetical protein KWG61_00410 [Allobaculum sp. Allo2]|nr:hypothetical protein KWG61_00410 [Allobaculum sp. Allo2]